MLIRPTWVSNPCVLGIDPGTSSLGVSIINYDLTARKCYLLEAMTLEADRLKGGRIINDVHGNSYSRMYWMSSEIYRILSEYGITEVYCEAPYLRKFPQAFAKLTECVNMVRSTVLHYSCAVPFTTIDPATVKMSVGVGGRDGDKSHMLEALHRTDIIIPTHDFYSTLDEHAVDATAVAYGGIRTRYY